MKRPWRAAWLSPFAALQLIVVAREGEEIAIRLCDYSAVSRLALARSSDPEDVRACVAFGDAERDLAEWCMSGVIEAQGCRKGPNGQIGEPEDISRYWSDTRHLDVTNGTLSGNPFFSNVTLNNFNVDTWARHDDEEASWDDLSENIIVDDDSVLEPLPLLDLPVRPVRRGRPPKAAWPEIKLLMTGEIERLGFPDPDGPRGWQSQSDAIAKVQEWVDARNEKAKANTVRDNTIRILDEIWAEKGGKA